MDDANYISSARMQLLISRRIEMFDGMSCLEIADASNNRKFLSHKAAIEVVDQFWNGIVNPKVATLRVTNWLVTCNLLVLLYKVDDKWSSAGSPEINWNHNID